ncbi:MAG: flagellar filament capping protein FliD [Eubacteriales bacterium]|nr:flagellar filament capping protein FliD [Eubacteriales bacterium]
MAIYTSNTNRVTGLSGIDTESMIDQMMKAESVKYNRLEKEKISVTWKQEAYRTLITAMQDFQNKWFGTGSLSNNIGYDAFWNNFTSSITDVATGAASNAISIKNTANSGKYEINVIKKAETENITGKEVVSSISTDKTASQIEGAINEYGDISLKFSLDGDEKTITITKDELLKAGSLEATFKDKLNAAFGPDKISVTKNDKGMLSFEPVGAGHSLTISEGNERTNGVSFTQNGALADDVTHYEIKVNGYTARVTFDASDNDPNKKLAKIKEAMKEAENNDTGEKKDLNEYVTLSTSDTGDLTIKNTSKTDKVTFSSEFTNSKGLNGVNDQELKPTGSIDLMGLKSSTNNISLRTKLSDMAGDSFDSLFPIDKDEITLNFGGKDVTINKDDTIQSLINKVNSSDGSVKLSFNEVTNRFNIEATESGAKGTIQIKDTTIDTGTDTRGFIKEILKIDVVNKDNNEKYTPGQDAEFEIDGIRTTRPSNEIKMNGIEFTINSTGSVVLETKSDVDATVEKIKSFVEDYNKLIDQINEAVTTNRLKTDSGYYEPLTDEEKKGLSEDEIKKLEDAAKKGLLHRDDGLTKFLTSLRQNIYKPVDIGGKTISLYEIGITTTSNYNDGGKLVIDEDKLKKALEERGDEVKQLFTAENGIADTIKNTLNDAIGSKGYLRQKAGIVGTSSVGNNDLTKELEDITKRLKAERERLVAKETYYFNMFAKMEAAMNQQNNQMAVLLSSFGG